MHRVTGKNYQKLGPGVYQAGEGLILRVRGGSRGWFFRYMRDKKRHDISLGNAHTVTLAEARHIADKCRELVIEGVDLKAYMKAYAEKYEKRAQEIERKRVTFGEYWRKAVDRIASVKRWRNEKHTAQWYSTIETYAVPVLENIAIADVKKEHILKVLEPIWETKTETATRLRSRLEAIFYLAMSDELVGTNPAAWRGRLEAYLPPASRVATVKHHECLTLDQTQRLIASLYPFESVSSQAMAFGILTATRPGEWVGAKWEEIDLNERVWTIPESRMKAGKEHRVPLSSHAMSILLNAKRTGPDTDHNSGYVFVSKWSKSKMSLDTPRLLLQRQTGTKATAHGFRSTFRDWCERTGVPFALSEKALAHAHQSQVVQAYQRDDLLEERRELMENWAQVVFEKVQ